MTNNTCNSKCKYLCAEFNCCTRPELNGRGVMLKKNKDGTFIRDCKNIPREDAPKVHKAILENICDMGCPYLVPEIGCCTRPELNNKGQMLVKIKGTDYFLKECDRQFDKKKKKKNKYSAKKVEVDGIVYDSKLEYERFCELSLLQKAKEISNLEHHKRYVLIDKDEHGREIAYEADFVYTNKMGETVVEDVKSKPTKTRLYALKKRLMLERYGIKIKEYMKE